MPLIRYWTDFIGITVVMCRRIATIGTRIGWDRIEMSPRLRQKHKFIYSKIQHSESHQRRVEQISTHTEGAEQSAGCKQPSVKPVRS